MKIINNKNPHLKAPPFLREGFGESSVKLSVSDFTISKILNPHLKAITFLREGFGESSAKL